jgi:hypothetical protein
MKVTRRTFVQKAALLSATLSCRSGRLWGADTSLPIASRTDASNHKSREILFTPGRIAERSGSYDRYEILQKAPQNPIFTAEKPWEEAGIGWGSVLRSRVDGKFKFIYGTSFPKAQAGAIPIDNSEQGKNECVVCYADSDDGIQWRRPDVKLYLQDEFPGNNIILSWPSYFNDSSSVIEDMLDPNAARRYKMLVYHHDIEDPELRGGCLFVSADALHWKFTGTVLPSQDAESLWQDPKSGRYYAFLKDRSGDNRSRLVVHSDDFEHWSEPQWIFTPDHGDHRGTNFYNQSVFSMAGNTLGFLNVYDLTTQTSWLELIESSDNINWSRMPSRPRLLEPGTRGSYDDGGTYAGLAEPILMGNEYRYYYYAAPDRHDAAAAGRTAKMKSSLAYATFSKGRLVGQQTEGQGYFSTIPFVCPGGKLSLNFVSEKPVIVSIKRWGYGSEYSGYTREECVSVMGDHAQCPIVWKTKSNLDRLQGKYIRLRIQGANIVAYSAAFEV